MSKAARLSLDLERRALHAVGRSYDDINGCFFRWTLERPGFVLADPGTRLGQWVCGVRLIELSRALLLEHGWDVLIEVLKHEMAHQYVHEVLGIFDETSHGPAFRKACEERGFDARAAGVPKSRVTSDETGRILERIAKLLALAESPNEHEAQAAMSAAQRLMLKYNLDALSTGKSRHTYRHLGDPSGRVFESQRILAALLGEYFFVEVIWVPVWRPAEGKRGSVLEVCGTLENIELAEYVHAFLVHTAERLWREHRRGRGLSGDARRQSFLAGVMTGFRDRLSRERNKTASEGLVWVGDPELKSFFRCRHPNVRLGRYGARAANDAYTQGRQAGQSIVLHRGVRGGCAEGLPRLLPSGRGQ